MTEMSYHGGVPPDDENSNVFPLQLARRRVVPEPYFSDEERREIREMLAYYREQRPLWEAITTECPTARRLAGPD